MDLWPVLPDVDPLATFFDDVSLYLPELAVWRLFESETAVDERAVAFESCGFEAVLLVLFMGELWFEEVF